MNRRRFISMLGLSALVAKVFPGVVKAKEPVLTVIETPRYYFAGVDVAYGGSRLILSRREFPEWGNVISTYEWDGKCFHLSGSQSPIINQNLCKKS